MSRDLADDPNAAARRTATAAATAARNARILELHRRGVPMRQIGEKVGRNPSTVHHQIHRAGRS